MYLIGRKGVWTNRNATELSSSHCTLIAIITHGVRYNTEI